MKKQIFATLAVLAALGAGCASSTAKTQAPTATPTAGAASTSTQTYTLDDVAKHASDTDCWMAIDGKVYDITSYVDKHPGGPAILKGCGKDATDMFNQVEKHGGKARDMLPTYQIGTLK